MNLMLGRNLFRTIYFGIKTSYLLVKCIIFYVRNWWYRVIDTTYSISLVKTRHFTQHGIVNIKVLEKGVIFYKAIGPFNLEAIKAIESLHYDQVFLDLRKKYSKWSEVVVFEDSCLFTSDAINELGKYIRYNRQHNIPLMGVAFVIPEEMEGASLSDIKIAPLYRDESFPFKRFCRFEDALNWAEQLLLVSD